MSRITIRTAGDAFRPLKFGRHERDAAKNHEPIGEIKMPAVNKTISNSYNLTPVLGSRIASFKQIATELMSELDGLENTPRINLPDGINIYDEVLRYEIELISKALKLTGNHQLRAAKLLGIKPTTLNSKIKRYRIKL